MKLETYLKINKIPVATFAGLVGVDRCAVYSYFLSKKGEPRKFPSPETMRKIINVTNGHVTPNDFYDLSAVKQLEGLPLFSENQVGFIMNN